MSKGDNKRNSTNNAVIKQNIKQNDSEKAAIFREVEKNLGDTEYNKNKKERKMKKKKHKTLKVVLSIFLVAILVFTGLFIKRWSENGWTLGGFVATILGHDANTLSNLPRVNVLVIGQSQNLTDTLLVCSYDPKAQEVAMLSIPRDTFVGKSRYTATAFDKINALYQVDPELLLSRVNDITGLDIKYYVKVDTKGLRQLVDSVGGVYFDVPIDMDYDDSSQDLYIHVKSGYQLLDGDKAEQVVRFRHNNDGSSYPMEYGDQDIGRMKTQRAFITEVIRKLAKPENITKVDEYIKIANQHVETNFNLWSLKDYAPYALDFKTENIKSAYLPGIAEVINGLWFYSHDPQETKVLVDEMFRKILSSDEEKNASIRIGILNGSGDDVKLENMKNLLKESGYTVATTGNTTSTKNTTIINRKNQPSEVAENLKNTIGVGIISNSSSSNTDVDFTIIIGSDY